MALFALFLASNVQLLWQVSMVSEESEAHAHKHVREHVNTRHSSKTAYSKSIAGKLEARLVDYAWHTAVADRLYTVSCTVSTYPILCHINTQSAAARHRCLLLSREEM